MRRVGWGFSTLWLYATRSGLTCSVAVFETPSYNEYWLVGSKFLGLLLLLASFKTFNRANSILYHDTEESKGDVVALNEKRAPEFRKYVK